MKTTAYGMAAAESSRILRVSQLDAQASEVPEEVVQEIESPSEKVEKRNGHKIAAADESKIIKPAQQKKRGVRV